MGLPFINPLPPPLQAPTASWRSKLTPSNIAFAVAAGVMCLMLLTVHHVELRTSHANHGSHTPFKSAVYTSLCSEHNPNLVGCSPAPSPHTKEAYVSFVSMIADPHYVDAMRLQLFAVRHDPLTRDPTPRDFVVLTTKHTPEWVKAELAAEGAVIRYTDIIEGMPGEDTVGGRLNYRDMYTKLAIWNLTDYDRVLYLDADILISKPMYEIWDDPNSDPPSGLAGLSDPMGQDHEIPIPDNGYINAGLLLLRPSNVTFKRLVETRDFDYGLFEQNLINTYFSRDGPHPWASLDPKYIAGWPTNRDLQAGIHAFHEKFWQDTRSDLDRELTELWNQRMGRMEGYYERMEYAGRAKRLVIM